MAKSAKSMRQIVLNVEHMQKYWLNLLHMYVLILNYILEVCSKLDNTFLTYFYCVR